MHFTLNAFCLFVNTDIAMERIPIRAKSDSVHRHAVRQGGKTEAPLVLTDSLEAALLVLHVKLIEKQAAHRLGSRRSYLTEVFL
jgi:hypothetical protein